MYLKEVKLWNFRKYGSERPVDLNSPNLKIPFKTGLNVLIGENDSGKTAIIDAIKIVLKTHSSEWIGIEESDFYDDSNRLRIELLFENLSIPEASHFPDWLTPSNYTVGQMCLIVFVDVEKNDDGRILPFDVRAGRDPEGTPLTSYAKDYLRTTYLKPLRDAKAELVPRRNSRLSQILRAHPAFKGNSNEHHLLTEFRRFNRTVANYFEGKAEDGTDLADQQGKSLKDRIDEYLNVFSGKKSVFEISEGEIKQILEKLELTFLEEENLGLGSHNLLFMSAELLHLNQIDWTGLRLGLIEEIEAHLHPQVQLQVINSLNTIASIQLIITSHSPNIGSKIELDRLIICSGSDVYPMGGDCTHLRPTDYAFLKRFLDVTKANLFFAKGVVLVEGWGEELLLPTLAKVIGIDLTAVGVSIINVGNTAALRYSQIFRRSDSKVLSTPVSVITDLDVRPEDERDLLEGVDKVTRKRNEKEQKFNGGCVRTFVSPHWTLEYCLALSPIIQQHLFTAVIQAGQEMTEDGYTGKTVTISWDDFAREKSNEQIAFSMYMEFIGSGKNISKSIIAQKLAAILESLPAEQFNDLPNDPAISYLINALRYAARIQ